jgi:type VI secretion system secreted protein VgrG
VSETRSASVSSPLGSQALLLKRMSGREEMGRSSLFELDLLSLDNAIALPDVLGKPMSVKLEVGEGKYRYFGGLCTRFAHAGSDGRHALYRATIRPWLWFLTRTANCRIFQKMTVPDIIKQVFRDHGFSDLKDSLSGSYREWEFLVQYRETDFNFVCRLMEREGIYFYFQHDESTHKLVLCDDYSGHEVVPGYEDIPYFPPDERARRERDHIDTLHVAHDVQPGTFVIDDYDFERPRAELLAKLSAPKEHDHAEFEIYDYPGQYIQGSDGESYVRARLQAQHAQYEQVRGTGNARGLAVGALFSLSGYHREDQNREYLVVSADYTLEISEYESGGAGGGSTTFRCAFSAIDSQVPYRSPATTPKPHVHGPQTALVVGPAGEEIWTDKYARVKVQFHWDRQGKANENSSCWVRVAQVWAGSKWGGIHIPRIGQEVIVDFLEGDPDQPIITGRVYNADNMPPYDVPANATQSGLKSRSTKGGAPDNFNELRFEDKKGEEEVYLQAEKNQNILVKNDETHTVGHDRKKSIGNDETTSVGNNRTEDVGAEEKITIGGGRTESVGAEESITIGANRTETVAVDETITVGANRTENVGANETVTIGGNRTMTVGASETLTVTTTRSKTVMIAENIMVGAARSAEIGAADSLTVGLNRSTTVGVNDDWSVGKNRSADVGGNDSLQVGKKLTVDAGDQIVFKTGEASLTLKKDGMIVLKGKGITIQGKDIAVKGSGKINVKASSDVVIKGSKIGHN